MTILTVNCNARMPELLSGQESGEDRQFILTTTPKKKLEYQIYVSNLLIQEGFTPFIEVKFVSKYSLREKRIEVVGFKDNQIKLHQFTDRASFDQDANELNRLISEISSSSLSEGYKMYGEIILLEDVENLGVLEQALKDMKIDISVKQL